MTEKRCYNCKHFEAIEEQSFTDTQNGKIYYVEHFDEIIDLLNKQDKTIKELKKENASMKGRIINAMIKSNQVECTCTTCVCEDYVNDELKKW